MKKLDELNEKLARLTDLMEKKDLDYKAEMEALAHEKNMLEEVIATVMAFLSEANEAFGTLCIAQSTGGVTAGDLKTYAQSAGLEIPAELETVEETEEETDAALRQTG